MPTRVLRAWADDAAAFCRVLARQDPSWGSETFELASGVVVLCGPGMYVNAAMATGLDDAMTTDEFAAIERRARAVGVEPAIEVSPHTHPEVRRAAIERGYTSSGRRSVLRRMLGDVAGLPPLDTAFTIEAGGSRLPVWQETAAIGWGHRTADRRRASDAFAAAAAEVDGDGFVLISDATDGSCLGVASLTTRDEVATLGAMATVATARRRGVQAAAIHYRLRAAAEADCTVATTSAAPGGDSERNLLRHGFEPWFEIELLTRTASPPTR